MLVKGSDCSWTKSAMQVQNKIQISRTNESILKYSKMQKYNKMQSDNCIENMIKKKCIFAGLSLL